MIIIKNLNKNYKKYLISLAIITTSIKIFGYACIFLLFLPLIYLKKNIIIHKIIMSNKYNKIVLSYFLLLSLSSIRGAIAINDTRIILFWIPLFICTISVYILNIELKNNIDKYINLLYKSSLIYFLYYFLMTIFSFIYFRNEYDIQNNLWIGSSVAFGISSILIFTLFIKWKDINFKIYSHYSVVLILYNFFILLHESKVGRLYFFTLTFFIILQNFEYKRIINGLLILVMIITFYSINSQLSSFVKNNIYPSDMPTFKASNIKNELIVLGKSFSNIHIKKESISGNQARIIELEVGINHFKKLPLLDKFIGTGWYSSRIKIVPTRNEVLDSFKDFDLPKEMIKKKNVSLQGIVGLLLDTGLIGLFFTFTIYYLFILRTFYSFENYLTKLFLITLAFLNLLVLFIGYPFVSIVYLLTFTPDGFLDFHSKNNFSNVN